MLFDLNGLNTLLETNAKQFKQAQIHTENMAKQVVSTMDHIVDINRNLTHQILDLGFQTYSKNLGNVVEQGLASFTVLEKNFTQLRENTEQFHQVEKIMSAFSDYWKAQTSMNSFAPTQEQFLTWLSSMPHTWQELMQTFIQSTRSDDVPATSAGQDETMHTEKEVQTEDPIVGTTIKSE